MELKEWVCLILGTIIVIGGCTPVVVALARKAYLKATVEFFESNNQEDNHGNRKQEGRPQASERKEIRD